MKRRAFKQAQNLIRAGAISFEAMLSLIRDARAPTDVRATASWFAGRLGKKSAAGALLSAMGSGETRLIWEAASGLACLGAKRSRGPLIKELKHGKQADLRAAAAYALGYIGGVGVTAALLTALGDNREPEPVRAYAAEALGNIRDASACRGLVRALSDASAQVRFWSCFALGQVGCQGALRQLRRIAATDHDEVPGWWSVSKEASDAINQIRRRQKSESIGRHRS